MSAILRGLPVSLSLHVEEAGRAGIAGYGVHARRSITRALISDTRAAQSLSLVQYIPAAPCESIPARRTLLQLIKTLNRSTSQILLRKTNTHHRNRSHLHRGEDNTPALRAWRWASLARREWTSLVFYFIHLFLGHHSNRFLLTHAPASAATPRRLFGPEPMVDAGEYCTHHRNERDHY